MLTPHHLKSFLSSFVYTPAYTCSHILTNEHDPHHYDVDTEPRVHCLEERSKAKEVGNYLHTSVPMGIRLKLFFAPLFLLISSVSAERSQIV